MRAILCWCALLVGVASCGDANVVVLTDSDTGSEVEVASGETFEIHLESNTSTGYAWELDAMSTPGLVRLISDVFDDPSNGDIAGEPGTQMFVFEATGEGTGILRMAYLRSFEDPPIPNRVVEFIVRIDGA